MVYKKAFAQMIVCRGIDVDSEDMKSVHWANPFQEPHVISIVFQTSINVLANRQFLCVFGF